MNKFFLLIILLYSSVANSGAYTGKSEILWIGTIVGDTFSISGGWSNPLNCSKLEQGIWKIYSVNNSIEELQAMYSTALAAYMSGKTIELYSHECDPSGRPRARSMYLPSRSGS